ncbi:hypothetical protein B0H14DRAFT_2598062 [Mycena olivaceomarginata]|nr:hypothetical protein B0H14DRAFT_2598062 [Mycena olivaceomarginata]
MPIIHHGNFELPVILDSQLSCFPRQCHQTPGVKIHTIPVEIQASSNYGSLTPKLRLQFQFELPIILDSRLSYFPTFMRLPPCSGVANTNEPRALGLLNRSSGLRRVLEAFDSRVCGPSQFRKERDEHPLQRATSSSYNLSAHCPTEFIDDFKAALQPGAKPSTPFGLRRYSLSTPYVL